MRGLLKKFQFSNFFDFQRLLYFQIAFAVNLIGAVSKSRPKIVSKTFRTKRGTKNGRNTKIAKISLFFHL